MSESSGHIRFEIAPSFPQQAVWSLEEQLQQISGVEKAYLREARDGKEVILLIISVGLPLLHEVASVGGDAKTLVEIAKAIFYFKQFPVHLKKPDNVQKHQMSITTKEGRKIDISNLSIEEIEQLLKDVL